MSRKRARDITSQRYNDLMDEFIVSEHRAGSRVPDLGKPQILALHLLDRDSQTLVVVSAYALRNERDPHSPLDIQIDPRGLLALAWMFFRQAFQSKVAQAKTGLRS